jgi:hypothetical protein
VSYSKKHFSRSFSFLVRNGRPVRPHFFSQKKWELFRVPFLLRRGDSRGIADLLSALVLRVLPLEDEMSASEGTRGRPKTPDYLRVENLAIAMAAQIAGVVPDQQAATLEAGTKQHYSQCLRDAVQVHGWPEVYWKGLDGQSPPSLWTVEDSIHHRPATANLWRRYGDQIAKCARNDLSPALFKWYNQTGEKPSGGNKEAALVYVKEALWNKRHAAPPINVDAPPTPPVPTPGPAQVSDDEQEVGEQDAEAAAVPEAGAAVPEAAAASTGVFDGY